MLLRGVEEDAPLTVVSIDLAPSTKAAGTSSSELFLNLIAVLEPGTGGSDTGAGTIIGRYL
jgi:hypothetical protein